MTKNSTTLTMSEYSVNTSGCRDTTSTLYEICYYHIHALVYMPVSLPSTIGLRPMTISLEILSFSACRVQNLVAPRDGLILTNVSGSGNADDLPTGDTAAPAGLIGARGLWTVVSLQVPGGADFHPGLLL